MRRCSKKNLRALTDAEREVSEVNERGKDLEVLSKAIKDRRDEFVEELEDAFRARNGRHG